MTALIRDEQSQCFRISRPCSDVPPDCSGRQIRLFDALDETHLGARAQFVLSRMRNLPEWRELTLDGFQTNAETLRRRIALMPQVGPQTFNELIGAIHDSINRIENDFVRENSLIAFPGLETRPVWLDRSNLIKMVETMLELAMSSLPDQRLRQIIERYYGVDGREPMTVRQISGWFNLSYQRVQTLKKSAQQKICDGFHGRRLKRIFVEREPRIQGGSDTWKCPGDMPPAFKFAYDVGWFKFGSL